MNILILLAEKDMHDILEFTLESKFGAHSVHAANVPEAMTALAKAAAEKAPVQLLIYHETEEQNPEFAKLVTATNGIAKIVVTQNTYAGQPSGDFVGSVPAAHVVDALYQLLTQLFESGRLINDQGDSEFCKIRTNLLVKVSPLKGDVYVRLSANKHVKMFQTGDSFDKGDMERFAEKKKLHYLHLRKADTGEFVNKYKDELARYLKDPGFTPETATKLVGDVQEAISDLANKVGFTPEVQQLTKTSVAMTVKAMGQNPNLAQVLERIDREKGKYISNHSTVTAHMACAIARGMTWSSDATYFKLTMAAFLHDMILQNDDLAQVRTLTELEKKKSKFTPKEIESFKRHPSEGARLAQMLTEIPPDVDTIIAQHHERPDGSGFPRKISGPYINNLSAVFIIAHEIAQQTLIEGKDVPTIVRSLAESFNSGAFKKIIQALMASISGGQAAA